MNTLAPAGFGAIPSHAVDAAAAHVGDILSIVVEHGPAHNALVVFDTRTDLACALTEAYRRNLRAGTFIDFDTAGPDEVLAAFRRMAASDLVVLVQSTNFRLEAFRIRVELFKLGLKVIEHVHLSRMPGAQGEHYIESLAYDPAYYRGTGRALKALIDSAGSATVYSGSAAPLVFGSRFEPAKLNIGDYSEMNNVGGQFPIGEVFTEAQDLEAVNGEVRVHVFGDTAYMVNRPEVPVTLVIERGRVVGTRDATPEFGHVLEMIRADEGEVWVRELGFGMNRAFTIDRRVNDIGTYERMCGIHLSLGAKHGVYPKPGFKRKDARYHIDIFAVTEAVYLDEQLVYKDGAWLPAAAAPLMNAPYGLTPQQHDAVTALDGPLRYKHFISRSADTQVLFGLRTDEGWVSACDDEGAEGLPVWPHPAYAMECATGEWAGSTPAEIDVYDFANDWLAAMAADGINAIIFPTAAVPGVLVDPARLEADLKLELSRYD